LSQCLTFGVSISNAILDFEDFVIPDNIKSVKIENSFPINMTTSSFVVAKNLTQISARYLGGTKEGCTLNDLKDVFDAWFAAGRTSGTCLCELQQSGIKINGVEQTSNVTVTFTNNGWSIA
jgi:hypothetical protein